MPKGRDGGGPRSGRRSGGDVVARGQAALSAGCDMVLVCNDTAAADTLLDGLWGPTTTRCRACGWCVCTGAIR